MVYENLISVRCSRPTVEEYSNNTDVLHIFHIASILGIVDIYGRAAVGWAG